MVYTNNNNNICIRCATYRRPITKHCSVYINCRTNRDETILTMLYYKLYRRRKMLFAVSGVLLVVMFLRYLTKPRDVIDDSKVNSPLKGRSGSDRVNIFNYVVPAPCIGCPGEGGAPVYLSVSSTNLLFIYYY